MSAPWPTLQFDEAVEDASGGNIKTKQNDYAEVGEFPIVDQGKALIAGYTDDEAALCKVPLPVVIFGDHTRCLKFVDFPFGMGADGVKVLKPKAGLDAKFLYHYLRQIKLPDGGYDRHFKYLKRETVPLPPLEEQRRIAAILDQAETLRTQRRTALALLDSLTQSLFLDMFGDPVANPKGFTKQPLSEVAEITTGSTPGRGSDGYYGGNIPWIKTTEVTGGEIHDTEEKLTESGLKAIRGKLHPINSIVVAMYGQGQTRGRCALLRIEASCNQACGVVRPSEEFVPWFMFTQLLLAYERLRALGRGGNQENLNLQLLGSFEVLLPPLPLQQTFATRIASIEALKATHRRVLAALDALFASLQQRAFTGAL